ncbi:cytochrome P450 [Mycetohabitans sp. B8]|uniref:Epi-isozizaene 5-monooxygenase/(E)-beta-farnesene synthase n=1 Tax=Burkholderia sp. B8(2020) TaxID=2713619 RepID=A0A6G6CWX0_9BURK|nr:cytochrome P450 [Mycetohabitans sp. B8]MCG1043596.1 cytochrome P450 [Mycetohabitans sp. B8]QIE07368.1 epi-isozizaene 5-monooxygenase/(E)-beta-farnesene synthase [Burkholderia sp. B8(2020)]
MMKTFKDLPMPPSLPILGHAHKLNKKALHLSLEKWAREYNFEPYRFQIGSLKFVVLSKPDHVRHVLKKRPSDFRRMREMSKIFDEVGFSSVFTKEGEEWRRQRPMIVPAFTKQSLTSFIPQIARKAARLRERLQNYKGEPIEIRHDFRRFSVDVGCLLVFGIDLKNIEEVDHHVLHTFHNVVDTMNKRLRKIVPYWRIVKLPVDRRFDESIQELKDMVISIARDVRSKMERKEDVGEHCILHTMLQAVEGEDRVLTDEELFANMMILVLGSEGTTAAMLSWLCFYLSQSEALQTKLRDEVSGFDIETVNYDALENLPLTEAVIEEVFRIRSTVPGLVLEALEDTAVDHLQVDKGTRIFALTRVDGIKDPETDMVFNPQRWLNDDGGLISLGDARQKQFPFGYGPRVCPGAALSNLEMKIVIAMLVKSFQLEIVDKEAVEEVYMTSAVPDNLRIKAVALQDAPAKAA